MNEANETDSNPESGITTPDANDTSGAKASVDLQALAEAVLALIKRELRIERERIRGF